MTATQVEDAFLPQGEILTLVSTGGLSISSSRTKNVLCYLRLTSFVMYMPPPEPSTSMYSRNKSPKKITDGESWTFSAPPSVSCVMKKNDSRFGEGAAVKERTRERTILCAKICTARFRLRLWLLTPFPQIILILL